MSLEQALSDLAAAIREQSQLIRSITLPASAGSDPALKPAYQAIAAEFIPVSESPEAPKKVKKPKAEASVESPTALPADLLLTAKNVTIKLSAEHGPVYARAALAKFNAKLVTDLKAEDLAAYIELTNQIIAKGEMPE